MNMLVMIKPPLFGEPGVKYEYKLVFLQIGSGLSQHYLYYNLSQPVHFQKIVWYYAILGLFCYVYPIHSSLFPILNNSTWLLNIVTGANSVFSWKPILQFSFVCLEYSLIYLHREEPRSHRKGSLYNMETLLWETRQSYKHEASQLPCVGQERPSSSGTSASPASWEIHSHPHWLYFIVLNEVTIICLNY